MGKLTIDPYEFKMLRIMNGELLDEQWGAWWTSVLEALVGQGLSTRGPNYQLTDLGRATLEKDRPNGE